jgi:glycosyltransferase involved in cell wall biosynthesis
MVLISVIIPLYNKKNEIGRAIHSVLNQTITDFEIIVIDDGSIDGSSDVMNTFSDPRIRLFRQENQGVSAARNNGVKNASADFLTFLDADDEWLPGHLDVLLRLKKRYPEAGIYTTAYKILEPDGKIRSAKYRAIPKNPREGLIPDYFKSAALGDNPMNSSSVGIPKVIFNEFGGFPKNAWWGEDTDLFGRIALKYPTAFSWEWCVIYHWDASDRACKRPSTEVEPFVKTAKDILQNSKLSQETRLYLGEYIARKEIYRAACHLFMNNRNFARDILKNAKTRFFFIPKISLYFFTFLPYFFVKKVLNIVFFK